MSDFEIQTSDAEATVAKVVRLTRADTLAWEASADPDVFVAPFKGEYVFRVSRFDTPDPEPYGSVDYSLAVMKGRRMLMKFGSSQFRNTKELQAALGDPASKARGAFAYF